MHGFDAPVRYFDESGTGVRWYRLDGRAGTMIMTPHGKVETQPLGAKMSEHQVAWLIANGFDPVEVEPPTVTLEVTVPNDSAIEAAAVHSAHAARAEQAAAVAASAAQTINVPLNVTAKVSANGKPLGRPRKVIDNGMPVSGDEL